MALGNFFSAKGIGREMDILAALGFQPLPANPGQRFLGRPMIEDFGRCGWWIDNISRSQI